MSLENQVARVSKGTKDTLKTLINKLGGNVTDELIDQYPSIASALDDVEPAGSAQQALRDAKSYTDQKISEIPTPDVSGQIGTHNADANAHADIRSSISNHTSDANIHVTAEEKTAWNAKADATHASQHASGGSDPITPAAIGAYADQNVIDIMGNGTYKALSARGWYRILTCSSTGNQSGNVLISLAHNYNHTSPSNVTAMISATNYQPSITILQSSGTMHFTKMRIVHPTSRQESKMFVDVYYDLSVANTCCVSALGLSTFTFGMSVNTFDAVSETVDGETVALTQAISKIPSGNVVTNGSQLYTYSTTDLTAGSSALATGKLYFVYE